MSSLSFLGSMAEFKSKIMEKSNATSHATSHDKNSADSIGEGVQYRRSGTSGHAPKTVVGKQAALNHFNDFLKTKKLPPYSEATEDQLCSIVLFQEFGTYLGENAKKRGVSSQSLIILQNLPLIYFA